MTSLTVHTIDLNFLGSANAIAAYLVPHERGAILIECGPTSTLGALTKGVESFGFSLSDITDLLVTHIHLDHAGASGWLAQHGARVHVHPKGAPHLEDPAKLLSSARRIYGDLMDFLWGEIRPVPNNQLNVVEDGEILSVEGLHIQAFDTPGHAYHHHVYLLGNICFSGDVGGVRMPGPKHLQLPCPPPEIHLGRWRESLDLLRELDIECIAPTHFGIYPDVDWHLQAIERRLINTEVWLEKVMQEPPSVEDLREQFTAWSHRMAIEDGLDDSWLEVVEKANPNWMSADGLYRYWQKYRAKAKEE